MEERNLRDVIDKFSAGCRQYDATQPTDVKLSTSGRVKKAAVGLES